MSIYNLQTDANTPDPQLQQLQMLQEQLMRQTQFISAPTEQTSFVDASVLSHIQNITTQLLATDKSDKDSHTPQESAFKKVCGSCGVRTGSFIDFCAETHCDLAGVAGL